MTVKEFFETYWRYYLLLEKDLLSTKRYIEIDEYNGKAYSTEYSKQYQAIGSEIDVFCKEFCKVIDNAFDGDKIQHYCKTITDNVIDFSTTKIFVKDWSKEICPWEDWNYKVQTNKKGIQKVSSNNPKWWTLYNKVKHQRTTKLSSYNNIPFYKYANQENVIKALGALYILEMACLELIKEKETKACGEKCCYEYEKSALFSLDTQEKSAFYQRYIYI
ncbi:MAG: hypothetical protein II988_00015 [Clostridia bacterium]|nr:hypothetical protein [Clostridia bacterium]